MEKVIEEAKSLPLDEQRQVREALEREARLAQIHQVQAKYAQMNISSEAFAARKAEEIALEDRHMGRARR